MGIAWLHPSALNGVAGRIKQYSKSTMIGPMIHVSSLRALNSVRANLHSFDLLTLLSPDHPETDWGGFVCKRHLRLAFHDIVEPSPGLKQPDRDLMQAVLDFGRNSEDQRALLIHCWAGISRSSAAAYAIACDRNPGFERDIALELRGRSSSATPNRLMVRLADDLLQRDGRMVSAIEAIGRGAEAREGEPYALLCAIRCCYRFRTGILVEEGIDCD
jgi:predicted protein tyrosine phosphatase